MGDDLTPLQYEVVSRPLSRGELVSLLPALSRLLADLPTPLTIMYGIGCNVPDEELWRPAPFEASSLESLITESERQSRYVLGEGDLIIQSASTRLRLCHESDVHLIAASPSTLEMFLELLHSRGVSAQKSVYSLKGPRSWSEA